MKMEVVVKKVAHCVKWKHSSSLHQQELEETTSETQLKESFCFCPEYVSSPAQALITRKCKEPKGRFVSRSITWSESKVVRNLLSVFSVPFRSKTAVFNQ